jgi:hypothetical protein
MRCGNALITSGGMTNGSAFVIRGSALLSSADMAIQTTSVEFQTNVCYSPDEDEGHIAS